MQEIFNFGFFIISPLFWLGLLHTQYKYRQRVKRERHLYESAINPKNSEMRTFFYCDDSIRDCWFTVFACGRG